MIMKLFTSSYKKVNITIFKTSESCHPKNFALQRLIIQNFSSCPSFSNKKDKKINKMTILYHLLRMNFYLFKVRESGYFNVFQYWSVPWMTKISVLWVIYKLTLNFLKTNLSTMTWKILTIKSHCCSLVYWG